MAIPRHHPQRMVRSDERLIRVDAPAQQHRQNRQKGKRILDEDKPIEVACWCQRRIVLVPFSVFRAGGTGTCGAEHCHPEGETHA